MAQHSTIEWTEATWNPITGCSVFSPGCTNCYAMKLAGTRLQNHPSRQGLTRDSKAGPVWTGEVRFNKDWLDQPLRWKRPRMIFVCAHADLFHDNVPDEWIDQIFAVMALAPHHTFQVLTKRSKRMREYLARPMRQGEIGMARRVNLLRGTGMGDPDQGMPWPLPNVWLGVSVEDQTRADERIPDLLATPAAVRWISAEPLLGPVDLTNLVRNNGSIVDALAGTTWWPGAGSINSETIRDGKRIDWVVAGGESGPGARPMHPDWARALHNQCTAGRVAFHFKQWGAWAPVSHMSEEQIDACYFPAPEKAPDARRRERVKSCVLHVTGARFDGEARFRPPVFEHNSGAMAMFEVGKNTAGRLLDGVEHNGIPEPRS